MNNAASSADRDLPHVMRGIAAGLLGGLAMDLFARAVVAARHGREADGAAPGRDRAGRGAQPPQADGRAEDDATIKVGAIAYRALTGDDPNAAARHSLGSAAHYAFSATVGACYAM